MRSSLLVLLFVLLSLGRAHADPAVEVPYAGASTSAIDKGACVKWSTGLVGTVCSFCDSADDSSCRVCRDGFGSATCSYGKRDEKPTFGACKAVGDDEVCETRDGIGVMRCRYSKDRAACYAPPITDANRADAVWIDTVPAPAPGTPPTGGAGNCREQEAPFHGRACVRPAPDGVHGRLCFYGDAADPLACLDVETPAILPRFGACSHTRSDNQVCDIGPVRCRYWGGPVVQTKCYSPDQPANIDDQIWIDDGRSPLTAGGGAHAGRRDGGGSSEPRSWHMPSTAYLGVELGMARPGASDFYEDGYGRAFVLGIHGFEARVFESYDLPDPKKMFVNVAGTSAAFVISSVAYRYQLASSSPISLSLLGGIAVMHRTLFGTSGDQIPGLEDFPEVQQQLGVGAMLGGGLVLFGHAYIDVRAYPAMWGSSGVGDNAASPGGTPITGNAGVVLGF